MKLLRLLVKHEKIFKKKTLKEDLWMIFCVSLKNALIFQYSTEVNNSGEINWAKKTHVEALN